MAKKRKETDRTSKELNGLKVELKWNGHGKGLKLQPLFGEIYTKKATFPAWLALITSLKRGEKERKEMETQKRKESENKIGKEMDRKRTRQKYTK